MPRTIVAGLDIGSSAIRLVVAEAVRGSRFPRVLAQVKRESRGLRRGYIINFEETLANLKETIREAERQSRTKLKSVFLAIGGITLEAKVAEGQVVVSKADLEITDNEIERVKAASQAALGDMTNRHILHSLPISYKLDGKRIFGQPEGLHGSKLEVRTLFVHCLNQHLNDLKQVVDLAGLQVEEVIAAPFASSIPTLTPTQKTAGVILANIGSQTTSLITFEEGVPIALQVLPIGSNDVTNDIALGLRIPIEEAEKMKLDPDSAANTRRKLDEIIEARLIDMMELIDVHLKKIGRNALLPAGIVIIGGGASVENISEVAKETLRLPARIFNPLDDNRFKNQIKDSGWIVSYGLCLYGLETEREDSWQSRLRSILRRAIDWFKDFWP